MNDNCKLGSLFDGSGGFPLAGSLCGIEPVWAAEVEPYPIAVTRSRFPKMKHLGDISKINGAEIEPVDLITFGSPCQDLSVAGKRAGLKHEVNGDEETTRSGLFMEAVRIIKEMRDATNGEYPRFALWENVPGAFSSNKGEDFRLVCEELIKIVEPTATMPAVTKNGWSYSDSYIGDGWSLAYRVFDAQYWGVPQRRRRIHLVADFRGERAREVLFEREGVRGYFAEGRTPWQATAADAQDCTGADDREGESNGADRGRQLDGVITIDQHLFENHSQDTRYKGPLDVSPIISATFGMGGNNQPFVVERTGVTQAPVYSIENHPSDSRVNIDESGKVQTLTSRMGTGGGNVPMVMECAGFKPNQGAKAQGLGYEDEVSPTLLAGQEPGVVYCLQGNGIDRADTASCNGKGWNDETCYTLNTIDHPAVCYRQGGFADYVEGEVGTLRASGGDYGGGTENLLACSFYPQMKAESQCFVEGVANTIVNGTNPGYQNGVVVQDPPHYIVRRLTPTECARLQGFADWWGHIEQKDDLTDEEYHFWLEVRNTHAAINGKKVQDYTKKQMLNWYNKLWTDSAEYKMWGNGIALPPALYCLQGIADALEEGANYDENHNKA